MPIRHLLTAALITLAASTHAAAQPFAIHVIDEDTGRGVPLVELKTTNSIVFITDSHGLAAIEAVDHRLCVERRAVAERDPFPKRERVRQAIIGDLVALREKGFDLDDKGKIIEVARAT